MFKTPGSRRSKALALAGMATALVASAAFPLLAGAETASPSVTATATPTSGLVDGQVINIHVDATPPNNPTASQIFGVEARICKPGAVIDFSADFNPTQTGNCVLNPLSAGTDTRTTVATAPPNSSADLTFRVGVGTDTYTTQSGDPVSITCDFANPCKLVLKLQVPGATQFTSFPLTYAAPSTVPDAPTALTALGGDGSAALSWTAPANDGGQPIDFYRITPDSGPTIQTPTNATTFNVTGLTNFTPYAYTVSAHNSIGYSVESSSVNVTPGPSPATNVSALGGQSAATVTWTAPANTTNLDYYRVTPYIGGVAQPALAQNTTGTPTSLVVTGLTNATQYTFSVAAHYTPPSAFGPESAPSGTATPGGKSVIQVISADRPAGDLYIAEACANGGTLDFNDTTQSCNVVLPTGVLNANATYYETSGAIQRVSILDTRDVDAGWNVNVQMGNFVGATTGEAFNGGCLGFAPSATELSNTPIYTQTVTAGTPVISDCAAPGLTTSTVAMNAAANGGLGRADLDAALALSIPVSAAADTYSATLTFTVI